MENKLKCIFDVLNRKIHLKMLSSRSFIFSVMKCVIFPSLLVLQELIGAAAGKLHTGRSRNDQVYIYNHPAAVTHKQ